ncbi:uracil transporter FurD [Tremella mesenterica]|uniref:Uracil transporter FurD n=1 Tax=Tremella mesenterica TaxID=5217 RepID=A0A4Q1BM59_TREME|nr:uracil transporter FurD [Tremella mesenterica]
MDPSPPDQRTWTSWTFFAYWVSDLINPGTWATVASFVGLGLTWWESALAILVGGVLVAIVITANAVVGAKLHTPFAVTSRAVFGYWGSKFVVFSRMVLAIFWLSINSWAGGGFVALMIESIWPQYAKIHNSIPASQGATTLSFVSFFLYWYVLLQLPFAFIHPSRLAWLFNTKAIVVPIVALGTLIWAVSKAGSGASAALNHPANRLPPGAPRFKAFMYSVTACQGTWATLSLNIGDFSRYCKKPSAAYIQLIAVPLLFAGLSVFSGITAACCFAIYGDSFYQLYEIVGKWNTSAGGRTAMFLASLAWTLASVTTNITANSISAANDMTTLAPKWINIKRGQLISLSLGVWAFAPWKVLQSAQNFLTFMSSYSVVLAPIAVLLAIDFFVVKKQKVDIYELYRPDGIYHFTAGWNWRSYLALACAVGPNLPGMINAINPAISIGNIKYIYMVSNISGDTFAIAVYLILCRIWPPYESLVEVPVHDIIRTEEFEPSVVANTISEEKDQTLRSGARKSPEAS